LNGGCGRRGCCTSLLYAQPNLGVRQVAGAVWQVAGAVWQVAGAGARVDVWVMRRTTAFAVLRRVPLVQVSA